MRATLVYEKNRKIKELDVCEIGPRANYSKRGGRI